MQDEAEEFIKYATSREQLLIAAAQGNPPPRKSVLKNLPATTEKNDAGTKEVQDNNQSKDSQNLDCSSRLMPRSDYFKCMARVHKVIDRYGDLFKAQEDSLEAARPRPRSRCWTEIEKVLGNHLQELIISPPNNSQSPSQAADAAVSQAKQELKALNEKRCWEFKHDTSHYH
jgi:ABC-type glycerol-3-phosphate transport system substrate-binding protein